MDFSSHPHDDGNDEVLVEQQENHWQPVFHPESDTDLDAVAAGSGAPNSDSNQQLGKPSHNFSFEELEEDDSSYRLDPAWGIRRTDSAHILDSVHRTSSFPTPQPDLSTIDTSHETSAQAGAEPVNEIDEQESYFDDRQALSSAHEITDSTQQEPEHDEEFPITNEEVRFEEGIPLISAPAETESESAEETPTNVPAFTSIEANEAGGFFDNIGHESQMDVMSVPGLERKDTSDVLHGMVLRPEKSGSPPLPKVAPAIAPTASQPKEPDFAAAFAGTLGDDEDPWKAAMGDEEEFLVEDADDLLPDSDEEPEPPTLPTNVRPSQNQQYQTSQRQNSNMYAPHQPTTSELTQFGTVTHNNMGLSRQIPPSTTAFQPRPQQLNINNRAESFVDQSKGGYKSPYDLPMDLAPKVKAHIPRTLPSTANVAPPPRTNSMNTEKVLQSPFTPTSTLFNQPSTLSPASQQTAAPIDRSGSAPVKSAPKPSRSASGFFEELPVTARPRPPVQPTRAFTQAPQGPPRQPIAPVASLIASPPMIQHQLPPVHQPPPLPQQSQTDPYSQFQLRAPEKIDPFANTALHPNPTLSAPAVSSRYSPAPPSIQNGIKSSPSPRYSPAPPPQPTTSNNRYVSQPVSAMANLPFLPRTSSPLAQHRRSVDQAAEQAQVSRPTLNHSLELF